MNGATTPSDPTPLTGGDLDRWLAGLLPEGPGLALVAVGSHGRGEASPGSDLDLVLLHAGRRDIAEVAEGLWYPIWDRGVKLDHSVRTVKEALIAASDDLKVALGLLDARVIAGDAALFAELRLKSADQWRRQAKRRLPELLEVTAERHERFGDVAFLLEPEVQEGDGGLRDVVVLRALAAASPAAGDSASSPRLRAANVRLLAVRRALHEVTGRTSDRLAFDAQDAVASALDLPDADVLMSRVSEAARTIAYCFAEARHRVQSALAGTRRRGFRREPRLGPGLAFSDGEIALASDARPGADPTLALRAASAAVEQGKRLGQWTLERLAAEAKPPPPPWPRAVLDAFVELLGGGHAAIPVIEALDQHRLMELYVPEWESVRFRHQRNAFHRFTVDRHLLEAVAEAGSLTRNVSRPDLLLVGAMLHDIGKGVPGRDHTDAGIDLARVIAPRMGFDEADVELLVDMVRLHLLLPEVATRRDLRDAATIERVAVLVSDPLRLELLAALTEADSKATGPAAWSAWKAGLLAELIRRVDDVYSGRTLPPPPAMEVPSLPAGEIVLVHGADRSVTVVARDRPGLFADVAGTLTVVGLDVRSAEVSSDPERGVAVERFEVETSSGDPADWVRFERELRRVLEGDGDLAARLEERDRVYGIRTGPSAAAAPPRVIVEDSLVEVRAPDVVGALWRITSA
ncbi:MAG: [protein-PII] uridylyltransferase, partial [Acidimicrobiia bacterium]